MTPDTLDSMLAAQDMFTDAGHDIKDIPPYCLISVATSISNARRLERIEALLMDGLKDRVDRIYWLARMSPVIIAMAGTAIGILAALRIF